MGLGCLKHCSGVWAAHWMSSLQEKANAKFLYRWLSVLPSPRSICRKSSLQKWNSLSCCSLESDQTAHTCSASSCPQGCHWNFYLFPNKSDPKAAKGWWRRAGKGRFCLCAMLFRLSIYISQCWSHLQKLLVILTKKLHLFSELICHNDAGISVM